MSGIVKIKGADMANKIDYKLLGSRVKDARNKSNLSQEKLAEILDVSSVYISRIENGTTRVSLKRLAEICIILNTDIGYILTGTIYESKNYQRDEIMRLLEGCKPDTIKLIKKIIEPVIKEQQDKM